MNSLPAMTALVEATAGIILFTTPATDAVENIFRNSAPQMPEI